MTTKRLAVLACLLFLGFGSVFLLPRQLGYQPMGIVLHLPDSVGDWFGFDIGVSEKEKSVLVGADFARKRYVASSGIEVLASVVLSGEDMNTGIHSPERCSQAQGWSQVSADRFQMRVADGTSIPVKRMHQMRPDLSGEGKIRAAYQLNYFWYRGHTSVTASDVWRNLLDMRDRLMYGYNQRWAFIMVSAGVPEPGSKGAPSEADVDKAIQDFIRQLVPKVHKSENPTPAVAAR